MRAAACLCVLVLISACGISVSDPAGPGSTAVAVLDPGGEPRAKLRYAVEEDLAQRMEISVKARVKTEDSDDNAPTFTLIGRVRVKAIMASGDARMVYRIDDVRVDDDVEDPDTRARVIRDAEAMKELRGTWMRSPTGALTGIALDVPDASRSVRERLALVSDALSATAIMFPDAELGAGATWQVTSSSALWRRKVTYRLRLVTEEEVVVEATAVMDAQPQVVRSEANETTELTAGSSNGTAALRIPLRELVATGWSEGTNEASFATVRGSKRRESTVTKETKFSIKPIGRAKRID